MNDFTKEELEDLLNCCSGGMHDDHPIEDYKLALQSKIQSMIDNYCEHIYSMESGRTLFCSKCNKPYGSY